MEPDDTTIIRLLKERDELGMNFLVAKHAPQVMGTLMVRYHKILDKEDIERLVFEASMTVWERAYLFDESRGTIGAWFNGIAHYCARSFIRGERTTAREEAMVIAAIQSRFPKTKVKGELTPIEPGITQPALFDGQLEDDLPSEQVAALRAVIEKLPRLQRAIIEADLLASDSSGSYQVASAKVLAKKFNTTENSINVSRNKARKALKNALSSFVTSRKEVRCHE